MSLTPLPPAMATASETPHGRGRQKPAFATDQVSYMGPGIAGGAERGDSPTSSGSSPKGARTCLAGEFGCTYACA